MTKRLLDSVLVCDIRNQLQNMYIDWYRFNYTNAYTTEGVLVEVIVGNNSYWVQPIKSYSTVVAFAYNGQFYEVGKYSQTTSKQVTQIYNKHYSLTCDRFFVDRLY